MSFPADSREPAGSVFAPGWPGQSRLRSLHSLAGPIFSSCETRSVFEVRLRFVCETFPPCDRRTRRKEGMSHVLHVQSDPGHRVGRKVCYHFSSSFSITEVTGVEYQRRNFFRGSSVSFNLRLCSRAPKSLLSVRMVRSPAHIG
jgi:hypothetical protein